VTETDIQRMRDQLFFEGPERGRRLSKFWSLLLLAGVIAAAGVVADSTATVIGAMIVAPLMTPILGIVLAIVLVDRTNLRRSVLMVIAGSAAVIALSYVFGLMIPYKIVAATNSQVAARVSPTLVDLVAAIATGAVGAVALARDDISDALPGVAIAISLVPPLAVVGLTLESGSAIEATGAMVLFLTNVSAILASGVLVMRIYRVRHAADAAAGPTFRRGSATAIVVALLVLIAIPLAANSLHFDHTTGRNEQIRAVAEAWATPSGWSIVSVSSQGPTVFVEASGPGRAPSTLKLRRQLNAAGFGGTPVEVALNPATYTTLPSP
jgi:uncharacterized hydrophobic protein (TIGR00271 family)